MVKREDKGHQVVYKHEKAGFTEVYHKNSVGKTTRVVTDQSITDPGGYPMPTGKPYTKGDDYSNMNRCISIVMILVFFLIIGTGRDSCAKGYLFHAAKKRIAKKIRLKGFSAHKMKNKARFGKGAYLSKSPSTAMKEKKNAEAMIRVEPSKRFKKNTINLTQPSKRKIRSYVKVKEFRGSVKKNVIGPKLGHKLGRYAAKNGKVIRYRSVKNPKGTNFFIPRTIYVNNKKIVRNIRVKRNGRYH